MNFKPSLHGIGKRFEKAKWSDVDPTAFADVVAYRKHARRWLSEGRGFLLSGSPGIGKTHTTIALMRDLIEQPVFPRFDFYVVTAPRLFELYGTHTKEPPPVSMSWDKHLETVPALILNDLGKEDRSKQWARESMLARLGQLLRQRHEEQLPVFVTTNLPLVGDESTDTIKDVYGESIWSLIYDLTAFRIQSDAEDRRKTRAQELWNGNSSNTDGTSKRARKGAGVSLRASGRGDVEGDGEE